MHLLRLVLSFEAKVDNTRSSIFEASRYFWTERMILTAHRVLRCLSYASTTFPNVPWPSNLIMRSVSSQHPNPNRQSCTMRETKRRRGLHLSVKFVSGFTI